VAEFIDLSVRRNCCLTRGSSVKGHRRQDFPRSSADFHSSEAVENGYGSADVAWDVPNGPQTKFNIASLTKQFTGMAVLQLAEAGKLKLDDPVSKYDKDAPKAWEAGKY